MKDKPPKELLSSYLDGEVSPLDEPEIGRHLAVSAEMQQELADYRRISELIQGLPVETTPPEFRAAVLQAAERQMLLPADDLPDRISGSHSGWRRRRWLVTGGVLASAAMLFLAVQLFDSTGPVRQSGGTVVRNESDWGTEPHDDARRTVASEDRSVGQHSHSPALASAKSFRTAETAAPRAPVVAMKAIHSAGDADRLAQKTKTHRTRTASGAGSGLIFNSNLKNAHVGETVQALEQSGNRVTVITLTVVDRQVGLDDLQVLLARYQIPKVPGRSHEGKSAQRRKQNHKHDLKKQPPARFAGNSTAGRAPAASPVSSPGAGELVAVYVEATSKQLIGVLGELQRQKQFVGLKVGRAIAVTQLDALSRLRVNGQKREQGELSQPTKKASRRKAGAVVTAESSAGGIKRKFRRTKAAQRKLDSSADGSRFSRQFRLALPAASFNAGSRKRQSAGDRHGDTFASNHRRKSRGLIDKKAAVRKGRGDRLAGKNMASRHGSSRSQSVQVLFVLVTVTNHRKSGRPPSRPRPSSKHSAPRKSDSRQPRDGMPG